MSFLLMDLAALQVGGSLVRTRYTHPIDPVPSFYLRQVLPEGG